MFKLQTFANTANLSEHEGGKGSWEKEAKGQLPEQQIWMQWARNQPQPTLFHPMVFMLWFLIL